VRLQGREELQVPQRRQADRERYARDLTFSNLLEPSKQSRPLTSTRLTAGDIRFGVTSFSVSDNTKATMWRVRFRSPISPRYARGACAPARRAGTHGARRGLKTRSSSPSDRVPLFSLAAPLLPHAQGPREHQERRRP
jgi:hypothetical protein